jgi:hypothetical protein
MLFAENSNWIAGDPAGEEIWSKAAAEIEQNSPLLGRF